MTNTIGETFFLLDKIVLVIFFCLKFCLTKKHYFHFKLEILMNFVFYFFYEHFFKFSKNISLTILIQLKFY